MMKSHRRGVLEDRTPSWMSSQWVPPYMWVTSASTSWSRRADLSQPRELWAIMNCVEPLGLLYNNKWMKYYPLGIYRQNKMLRFPTCNSKSWSYLTLSYLSFNLLLPHWVPRIPQKIHTSPVDRGGQSLVQALTLRTDFFEETPGLERSTHVTFHFIMIP